MSECQNNVCTNVSLSFVFMYCFQKADMIAADLTVTSIRHKVLDYSRPFMTAPLTILTKVRLLVCYKIVVGQSSSGGGYAN
jgi:hypothetical protein